MSLPFHSRLCRLCLRVKKIVVNLHEANEHHGFVVADVLNELMELEVSPSDGLPNCICNTCLDEVERFRRFKKECHESKKKLKNVIMQSAEEVPESPSRALDCGIVAKSEEDDGEDEGGKEKVWSQKLLDLMDGQMMARRMLTTQEYLENLPAGYTSVVDPNGQEPVEPFEAVDCVVGAFGYELDSQAIANIGSSCMEHPLMVEGGRGIKVELEDSGSLTDEAFLASMTECKYRHRCSICSKLFGDVPSLREHVESKVCAIPMQCKVCPKTFFGKRRLQKHVYNCHRTVSLFECPQCSKKFSKKDHLNRHILTHTTEKPYGCPKCHRRYKGERQLECHMYYYHKICKRDNFPCNLCGKLFVRQETLDSHVCPEPREFVCDECGLSYGTKHELKHHVWRLHLNHLPHSCITCKKDFTSVSELNQHQVVHQVERPFACPKCSTCFKTERHLKQHAAMCLSERKVKSCYVCGDTFTSDADLTAHKKVHSQEEEKRYSCDLCENTYKKSSYLKQHVKRCHLEEKSFACSVCAKTFAVRSDLRQHSMVHSELRPYTCGECGKSYKHKQALHRHVTTTHVAQRIAQSLYI